MCALFSLYLRAECPEIKKGGNTMKRTLSVILSLCMLLSCL